MTRAEILCTDLLSVERAAAVRADRIELCAALEVGGVTPGPGLQRLAIRAAREAPHPMEVIVLVRPRRGDFVLDGPGDLDVLCEDIVSAGRIGASGVAVGVLTRDDEIDVDAMRALQGAAGALPITFHRAVDHTPDLFRSFRTLTELGIPRVLTSGGAATAWEGRAKLAELVSEFGDSLEVIAGGGVSGANASVVLEATGVHALHGSCAREVVSTPSGGARTNLGKPGAPSESSRLTVDESSARALVSAVREFAGSNGPSGSPRDAAAPVNGGGAPGEATLGRADLDVHVHDSVEAACDVIATEIVDLIAAKPDAVLGLATGSTMLGVYARLVELIRSRDIDVGRVTTFNLDEYVGVAPDDANSFRAFMRVHLFEPAGFDMARCHFPEVAAAEMSVERAAELYERRIIDAGGIDLQLLGIGRNGHVAFNEPGSSRESRTRQIDLDAVTRRDAADAFGGIDRVPRTAVTMGVATILDAARLRILAFGDHKAEIVRRTLDEAPSDSLPCTWLRGHPDVSLHVDTAAGSAARPRMEIG